MRAMAAGVDQILRQIKGLEKAGDLAAARKLCQQTLATYPANARLREVWTRLNPSPHPSQSQFNTLRDLFQAQDFPAVLTQGTALATLFPRSHSLFNILAAAATRLGQPTQAAGYYRRAIAIEPDFLDAHTNLGQLWLVTRDWSAAAESFARALALNPKHAAALTGLAVAEHHRDHFSAALGHFQAALRLTPDHPETLHGLAKTLMRLQEFCQAQQAVASTLRITPQDPDLHLTLARIRSFQGDTAAAEQDYLRAMDLGLATAARELADLHRVMPDDPLVDRLAALRPTAPADQCHIAFARFKMLDDLGQPDQAFACLTQGNALRRVQLGYDPAAERQQFQALHQTAPQLARHGLPGTDLSPRPIFIVGMPRSGTSLVEQILTCHSAVAGGGELPWLGRLGLDLATGKVPVTRAAVHAVQQGYLREISSLAGGRPWITDKMPHNFRLVALIRAALPQAHIVHVHRNPAAVCWSNYKHYFSTSALGFAYDLADVAAFHGLYTRLMQDWASRFGSAVYALSYEALTQDPEGQTRRLLDLLGLSWEDACLSPQNNRRAMRTVSQDQVRQPVYQGSSDDWRRYAQHLNGAFDSL